MQALTTFITSLGLALAARLTSVGAAVVAGFTTILINFSNNERQILLDVKTKFNDSLQKRLDAGQDQLTAIEGAASDAYNVFCNEEKKEFAQEAGATILLAESAAKRAAGIVGSVLTTSVIPQAAAQAAGLVSSAGAAIQSVLDAHAKP